MDDTRLVLIAYCAGNQSELVAEAEKRGLPVEILANNDRIYDILIPRGITHVVGVCCPAEIASITPHLDRLGISYRAIEASAEGLCFKQTRSTRAVSAETYHQALDWLASEVKR